MRTFYNDEWNFSICYPDDWRIIYENEPAAAWMIPIAVVGPDTGAGFARVTLSAQTLAEVPTRPAAMIRILRVHLEGRCRELEQTLAGFRPIALARVRRACRPAVRLVYSYHDASGWVVEESTTVLGPGALFQFACSAPAATISGVRPCFESILASFCLGVSSVTI